MTDDLEKLKALLQKELAKDSPDFDMISGLTEQLLQSDPDRVRFSVDAGHVQRLGVELVGKAETALAELVKNAYDADAIRATVTFENAARKGGTLVIKDDGIGMTEDDIRQSWMRLSTGMKVNAPHSTLYGRSRAGRKGIGRFAAQRLGGKD